MVIEDFVNASLHYIQMHQGLAVFLVFIFAFGESLAIISILLPAMAILFGCGALIGSGHLDFLPIWLAGSVGAVFGDFLSYWLGYYYHEQIRTHWPMKKHPELYLKGEQFFLKYGIWSIFVGRFFGPLRAIVPLIAGAVKMKKIEFNLANVISAPIWAFVILMPGMFGIRWIEAIF